MSLDIAHLLSAGYLLNLTPGPLLPIMFKTLVPVFGGMIILGFAIQQLGHKNSFPPVKTFFSKLNRFMVIMGLLGLVYVFFRQQEVYLVSAPFWIVIWIIASAVWIGIILKYYFTDKPKREEELRAEAEKKKYLPKQ